jgi:hypothetical protein
MKLAQLLVCLFTLIGLGCVRAQLPNLRVGLPRDEDSLRCALVCHQSSALLVLVRQ